MSEKKQTKTHTHTKNEPTDVTPEEPKKVLERFPSKRPVIDRADAETILINGIPYKLVENYREAFNMEELENRFSDLLEKYDYIFADISDQKARLKGFYRASYQKAPPELRISNVDEYRLEACNFGSPYYILERADGKKGVYTGSGKPSRRKQSGPKKDRKSGKDYPPSQRNRKNSRPRKQNFETKEASSRYEKPTREKAQRVETVKDEKGRSRFHIRKKEGSKND